MEELRLKTMYGDVVVPCKLETNFMKVIDRIDESDAYKLFKGKVVFDTIIAGNPFPQEREINIGYAIYTDICGIVAENKRMDGKHQVDIKTLDLWRINIDGAYLRITWTFNDIPDEPESRRMICGNLHEVLDATKGWSAFPVQRLQVAW